MQISYRKIRISLCAFFMAFVVCFGLVNAYSTPVYANEVVNDGAGGGKTGNISEKDYDEFKYWYGSHYVELCEGSKINNACDAYKNNPAGDNGMPFRYEKGKKRIVFDYNNGTTYTCLSVSEAKKYFKEHVGDVIRNKDGTTESTVTNDYDKDGLLETTIISAFAAKVTLFGTDIDFSNIGDSMASFLDNSMYSLSIDTNGKSVNLYDVFKTKVYPAAQGMAVSLLTIMILWKFIKEALEVERFSWQRVVMIMARAFIVNMFVLHSFEILTMFFNTVMSLMGKMSLGATVSAVGASGLGQVFASAITNANHLNKIIIFLTGLFMVFTWYGTATAVVIQVLTRYIKILFAMALSPIPISLTVDEQHGTDAMRYLLWAFGVFLQAPIIQVCIQIYNLLLSEYSTVLTDLSSVSFGTVIPLCLGIGLINGLLAAMISMAQQITDKMIPA